MSWCTKNHRMPTANALAFFGLGIDAGASTAASAAPARCVGGGARRPRCRTESPRRTRGRVGVDPGQDAAGAPAAVAAADVTPRDDLTTARLALGWEPRAAGRDGERRMEAARVGMVGVYRPEERMWKSRRATHARSRVARCR